MPIEWRADNTDVRDVVFMIQDVEGIDRQRSSWSVLSAFRQHDSVRQVEIEIDVSRSVQRISWRAGWPIQWQAVVVVVISGRNVYRLSRVEREGRAKVEPFAGRD